MANDQGASIASPGLPIADRRFDSFNLCSPFCSSLEVTLRLGFHLLLLLTSNLDFTTSTSRMLPSTIQSEAPTGSGRRRGMGTRRGWRFYCSVECRSRSSPTTLASRRRRNRRRDERSSSVDLSAALFPLLLHAHLHSLLRTNTPFFSSISPVTLHPSTTSQSLLPSSSATHFPSNLVPQRGRLRPGNSRSKLQATLPHVPHPLSSPFLLKLPPNPPNPHTSHSQPIGSLPRSSSSGL